MTIIRKALCVSIMVWLALLAPAAPSDEEDWSQLELTVGVQILNSVMEPVEQGIGIAESDGEVVTAPFQVSGLSHGGNSLA